MRVTFASFFRNGVQDINRAASDLFRWQQQVSSLKRVAVPSDDPSAMSGIIAERAQMRGLDQYVKATDSVDSRLRVVDSALSDLISHLTAAKTAAIASRQSFLTPEQREAYALQLEGLRDAILTDVNLQFRGTYLFGGTSATVPPYSKDGSGVVQAYAGDHGQLAVDIDQGRSLEVSFDGEALVGTGPDALFAIFADLIDAVRAADGPRSDTAIAGLERAFDRTVNTQSRVGNSLATLDDHRLRLGEMRMASDARRSKLEDANLAEAISGMQQADAAHRAALGAVSTASRLSLLDYLR
jgi:flagellar hook-associated protein 3 FlgL